MRRKREVANRTRKSIIKCPECDNEVTIYRKFKRSKRRGEGHIKDFYCYKCREVTKHVQQSSRVANYGKAVELFD